MHSLKVVPNHLTPIHSDHHIITFYLSVSRVESPYYVYDFGKGDYPELCSYLYMQ